MDKPEIGRRLKMLRGDRTLEEVGKALNVTSMAVSSWELGKRVPNDDMKVRIANYFGVSLYDLFFAEKVNGTLTPQKE